MVCIGFSTQRRNLVSRFIRWVTSSEASHTWLLMHDPLFDMYMVMEAHELGFRLVPFSRFSRHNDVVAVFEPEQDLSAGLHAAAHWLGYVYDFAGLLGGLWVMLGRVLTRRRWRNPFRSRKALFCSEAVVRLLKAGRFTGAEKLHPEETTPQDLRDFLRRAGVRQLPDEELRTRLRHPDEAAMALRQVQSGS